MENVPNEVLHRILVQLLDRRAFFTLIPLVCRRFRAIQCDILKATTVNVTVGVEYEATDCNVEFDDLEAVARISISNPLEGDDGKATISNVRNSILQFYTPRDGPDAGTPWCSYLIRWPAPDLVVYQFDFDEITCHEVAETIKNALHGVLPFGRTRFPLLRAPHTMPINRVLELAICLEVATLDFPGWDFREDASDEYSQESTLELMKALPATEIQFDDPHEPLSTILLFPYAKDIVLQMQDDSAWEHGQRFDSASGSSWQHRNLETLLMGSLPLINPEVFDSLIAAVQRGAFPQLHTIKVGFKSKFHRTIRRGTEYISDDYTLSELAFMEFVKACPSVLAKVIGPWTTDQTGCIKCEERLIGMNGSCLPPNLHLETTSIPYHLEIALECPLGGGFCIRRV
ncbi:hypothetical protein M427DRAFT_59807 [Gonapodya prolifera JEL478]|uniref:F-box domain-containing protein n=1 Tax=Gonapodya prolifera (strain JEL478) TaxID=1344416 RepID=A0A139A626_GONPJ|nr:hypothetical protein M427DRAFT_59807 [Gonapodya prolifera JEL478]|eukprot:KXS12118.1 hypothetical protein M427DRAFT_59807 [Gonapodya prolifera JEL478]